MLRNLLAMICIMGGCLAYGAIFVDDTAARLAEAELPVHRPSHDEFVVAAVDAPANAPLVIPENVAREDEVEIVFRMLEEDPEGGFVAGSGSSFKAFIKRDEVSIFLESSLAYVEERRADTQAQLDKRLELVFASAFADKDAAVSAYADWFYGWGNSFKFVYEAMKGAGSALTSFDLSLVMASARLQTEDYMRQHYTDLVLQPEIRDPAIVQGIEAALEEAHQDYLRSLRNIDARVVRFIGEHARYVEKIDAASLMTIDLDWDAEKWKAPTFYARDAYLAGLGGISLLVGGQLAAPAIEQAVVAALAPVIGEMMVTAELTLGGALLGSEVPILGTAIGALAGLSADYLINLARETMTRQTFEQHAHQALEASIARWQSAASPAARTVVDHWFDETLSILATPDLEAKLEL